LTIVPQYPSLGTGSGLFVVLFQSFKEGEHTKSLLTYPIPLSRHKAVGLGRISAYFQFYA